MITKRMKRILRYRVKAMIYLSGASNIDWDDERDCMIPANNYLHWNVELLFRCGLGYPFIMSANLLLSSKEGQNSQSLQEFGVYILGWVEVCLISAILTATYRFNEYRSETLHMMNEVFRCSEKMEEFMHERKCQLSGKQRQKIVVGEWLITFAAVISTFVPLGFVACVCHPLEPTHRMIEEWLEVNVSLQFRFIPFLLLIMSVISKAAVTVFNGIIFGFCYLLVANIGISSIIPEHVTTQVQPQASASNRTAIRCNVQTKCFGTLDDMTVIRMYRTQQVLNVLINEIYGSMLMSFHHVAALVVFVGLGLTLIKVPGDILISSGPLIFIVLVIGPCLPPFVEYWETVEIAEVTEVSKIFLTKCRHLLSRRSMLRKVVMSCPTLTLKAGHPFFKITKHTFLEFMHQGIDFMISILAANADLVLT